ncbi:hypothetical protein OAL67_00970 [bacterium]|nr:hypothetical protein [bacterium]
MVFNKIVKKVSLELIYETLVSHDRKFDHIFNKLEEHDKKFEQIEKKLDTIQKTLEKHQFYVENLWEADYILEGHLKAFAKANKLKFVLT